MASGSTLREAELPDLSPEEMQATLPRPTLSKEVTMPREGEHSAVEEGEGGAELGYTQLKNLSIGGAADYYKERTLPLNYRTKGPGEINNYEGAGIIPVTYIEGKLNMLICHPLAGPEAGIRWFDFGGKKSSASELPADCACRAFTEASYGIFSLDSDWENENIRATLPEVFGGADKRKSTWPLLLKSGSAWAKQWVLESDACGFYNPDLAYHLYLLPVHYVPAEVLNEVSMMFDPDNLKEYQWVAHDVIQHGPLHKRVQIRSLFKKIVPPNGSEDIKKTWMDYMQTRQPSTFSVLEVFGEGGGSD